MRDGSTEGMQHFDGEIERLVREGIIDVETAMNYATNPGNLGLEMADFEEKPKEADPLNGSSELELEIER